MRKHALSCVLAAALLLALPIPGWAGDGPDAILVIANKGVAATSITSDQLRPVFQTKKDTFPDGTAAKPFNLPDTDPSRRGFDAAVLGLDPDRVARYWIDRKIRGGERPPQNVPSGSLMVKVVGKTAGGIGYVDAKSALDANVKVLARIVAGQVVKP
jgi:hypothetical protein